MLVQVEKPRFWVRRATMLPSDEAITDSTVNSAPSSALRLSCSLPNSFQNTQTMPAIPSVAPAATRGFMGVPKNRRDSSMAIIGLAE